jgi:cytosine/adenosine deaminase-related metal-dependent hydrolase
MAGSRGSGPTSRRLAPRSSIPPTVGKRADIILIRGNDINIAPVANIETAVVQSAMPANVDTVLVDGRIVKRHGRLVAYDVEKVVRDAKASALRIRSAAGGVLAPAASR